MASENKRKIGVDVNELLKRKDILNSRTKFIPKTTVVKDINPEKVFTENPIVSMPISTKKADTKKKVSAFSIPEFPKVIVKENSTPVNVVAVPINAEEKGYQQFEYKVKELDAFMDFLAQPPFKGKGIRTQKQFAKAYKVDETTLGRWKKKKGFWDEVERRAKDMRKDKTVTLMDRFFEQMMMSRKPVGRDILVWLQYIQGFNPKLGIIPMGQQSDNRLDPEQRKQLAQAYLNAGLLTQQEAQMVVDEGLEPEDLEV